MAALPPAQRASARSPQRQTGFRVPSPNHTDSDMLDAESEKASEVRGRPQPLAIPRPSAATSNMKGSMEEPGTSHTSEISTPPDGVGLALDRREVASNTKISSEWSDRVSITAAPSVSSASSLEPSSWTLSGSQQHSRTFGAISGANANGTKNGLGASSDGKHRLAPYLSTSFRTSGAVSLSSSLTHGHGRKSSTGRRPPLSFTSTSGPGISHSFSHVHGVSTPPSSASAQTSARALSATYGRSRSRSRQRPSFGHGADQPGSERAASAAPSRALEDDDATDDEMFDLDDNNEGYGTASQATIRGRRPGDAPEGPPGLPTLWPRPESHTQRGISPQRRHPVTTMSASYERAGAHMAAGAGSGGTALARGYSNDRHHPGYASGSFSLSRHHPYATSPGPSSFGTSHGHSSAYPTQLASPGLTGISRPSQVRGASGAGAHYAPSVNSYTASPHLAGNTALPPLYNFTDAAGPPRDPSDAQNLAKASPSTRLSTSAGAAAAGETPEMAEVTAIRERLGGAANCSAFISKLWYLMCRPELYSAYLRWSEAGDSIILFSDQDIANDFASDVLPRLFKHGNNASFVRQLNLYGFQRVPSSRLLDGVEHKVAKRPGGLKGVSNISTALQYYGPHSSFSHPRFLRDREDLLTSMKPRSSKKPKKSNGSNASAGGVGGDDDEE
ncbi:heat shock transcription factor [Ceraceosorus bombacis]|uniref:Heat shock transcription factor n=1 Tax=Ceraceosorus bombacis TaxID=401625 RepID=A0A0P1BCA6_9BASI|nr:heat shock transcription factor [Ceraceosorus bombacis]